MKKALLLLILLISSYGFSQVMYTEPEFPTENDSIIVFFDVSKADREDLVGYTGVLYTHTGVNTNIDNWQYVIGNWGEASQPTLERIDTDLYKLVIGYPRDYYNISDPTETIISLNFVLRNAGASQQTEDLFLTLFQPGITVVIDSPSVSIPFGDMRRSPVFNKLNDEIAFKVKVATIDTDIDSINLYKNDELLKSVQGVDSLYFTENAVESGNYFYTIIARDLAGFKDTTYFCSVVRNEIIEEPLPTGAKPGVTFMDDGSAVISLFAPHKEFIYLLGDFNDWMVDNNYLMKKYAPSKDSVMFWFKMDDIIENQVYQFQYLIDGEIRVADHFTSLLLDPWNDKYINNARFPNMPQYPNNKTEHYVSTFEKKTNDFEWTDQSYVKPENENLVIYETLIRDFTEDQTYLSLLGKLDYLDSLGINVIELMPINEFEGNLSWGYNPAYYFAVDKYYGSPDDLRTFVNECHNRGIAVVADVVYNHAFGSNGMARMYLENGNPSSQNPWFNRTAPHTDYSWGYDFDHESEHTKYFMDRANHYWMEEYHIDGFRFDFTRGFTNKSGGSGPYDSNRINVLKRMADKIWEKNPDTYVILEHLVDSNDEMKVLADYGMLLWGNMNHDYNEAAMGYSSNLTWGFYESRSWNEPNLVTYMESHDEERLMYKNLQFGNSYGNYDVQELAQALQRQKLVNAFFLTLPGPKMIWQFGELGYDYSINYDGRLGEKPLRWDYYEDANRRNLYDTVKELIKLRNTYDVFTNKNTSSNLSLSGTIKQIKMTGSKNIHIVGNFGVNQQTTSLSFVHGGTWNDFFSGDTIDVTGSYGLTLEPGEFHIYSDSKLFTPKSNILVGIEDQPVIADKFEIYPAYPNPFNPGTTIGFNLPANGDVKFQIYNILGQLVESKQYTNMTAGYNEIRWNTNDGINIPSGVYFISINYLNHNRLSKVILMK